MLDTRVLNINGLRFIVPQSVSAKDLQSFIGFMATLATANTHYDYDTSSYLYEAGQFPEVRLEVVELLPDAKQKAADSYERYKAKRAAEQSA